MPNKMNHAEVAENLDFINKANMIKGLGAEYEELVESIKQAAIDERRIANGELVPAPVKCGECKHYADCEGGLCTHPKLQCDETPPTQKDRSCSYGERKDGESHA